MGFQVQVFRPGGDGGIDCVVYDPRPMWGGKFCVQVKQYVNTVPPSAVRDLFGAVQHEGATKGLLITTSRFGPGSYEWANGKPLHLITGTELLSLCHENDIPARILRSGKKGRARYSAPS
jgi:restriction system protein